MSDDVTFPCQHCDNDITFSEVSKVTDEYQKRVVEMLRRDPEVAHQMDESYVEVQPAAGESLHLKSREGSLAQILELASTHSHVDHPICTKCLENIMRDLQEKTTASQVQAKAYEDALNSLLSTSETEDFASTSQDELNPTGQEGFRMTEEQLLKQLGGAERERQVEQERTKRLEAELETVEQDLAEVLAQEQNFKSEENDFWRRFDALWLDLQSHLEEVEAVSTRVNLSAKQLDSLRQTSVLEDCFHIWFKDRFGTISGFRLGRHKEEVKWSEVNAAWGQAILLLDMITRMYPDFSWSAGVLKPMASHSMVSDGKEDYVLYGPVSRVWSGKYDKAMNLYLQCLDSFARFVRSRAQRQGSTFVLPNPIDPEKGTVRGLSIRYGSMVNNTDNWNKVLKYMLVDLKILLHWVTQDQGVVNSGSAAVPHQMTAAANATDVRQGNPLASSTLVVGTTPGSSAERGAQSMMQTGCSRGALWN